MRSDTTWIDLNPIPDEGAPTSTEVTYNAAALCDMLSISLIVNTSHENYDRGCGINGADSKTVVCLWC